MNHVQELNKWQRILEHNLEASGFMSTTKWRWDQGRLEYFEFDNIRSIARTLVQLDGAELNDSGDDPLRAPLMAGTGLPFKAGGTHKVWRNFGRVFGCAFLAADYSGRLNVTNACRALALPGTDVDEYLSLVIPNFYFPFPAFKGYSTEAPRIFPFCAVLKFLLAAFDGPSEASICLDDIFSLIIGNGCTGLESLAHYSGLKPTGHVPPEAHRRQVREMLIFVSQSSFLKWYGDRLYLDILPGDLESYGAFLPIVSPIMKERDPDRKRELLDLGERMKVGSPLFAATTRRQPADVVFTEGKKVRATHLRTERSPQLRNLFFSRVEPPYLCHICGLDAKRVYPWTDNILEVHHLLPLCSGVTVSGDGTSLDDVVGLCPNCHKSIHTYYKIWLNDRGREDFSSRQEAKMVYSEAKDRVKVGD